MKTFVDLILLKQRFEQVKKKRQDLFEEQLALRHYKRILIEERQNLVDEHCELREFKKALEFQGTLVTEHLLLDHAIVNNQESKIYLSPTLA